MFFESECPRALTHTKQTFFLLLVTWCCWRDLFQSIYQDNAFIIRIKWRLRRGPQGISRCKRAWMDMKKRNSHFHISGIVKHVIKVEAEVLFLHHCLSHSSLIMSLPRFLFHLMLMLTEFWILIGQEMMVYSSRDVGLSCVYFGFTVSMVTTYSVVFVQKMLKC